MRVAAIALVLLLSGCAAAPMFTSEEYADTAALKTNIGEIDGVDESTVVRFPTGDNDEVRLTIDLGGVDPDRVEEIVTEVADLVGAGPFDGDTREVSVYLRDSNAQFSLTASEGDPLPVERITTFSRLLADARVSDIRWHEQLEIGLETDGVTDNSLEEIYGELGEEVTSSAGGVSIFDPGAYTLVAAGHPYTEERFAVAREITAIETLISCTLELEAARDGSFKHHVDCYALEDLNAMGKTIEQLLDARGLLDSTEVTVRTATDEVYTHEGKFVLSE